METNIYIPVFRSTHILMVLKKMELLGYKTQLVTYNTEIDSEIIKSGVLILLSLLDAKKVAKACNLAGVESVKLVAVVSKQELIELNAYSMMLEVFRTSALPFFKPSNVNTSILDQLEFDNSPKKVTKDYIELLHTWLIHFKEFTARLANERHAEGKTKRIQTNRPSRHKGRKIPPRVI